MTRNLAPPVVMNLNRSHIDDLFSVALEIIEENNPDAEYIRVVNDNAPMTFEGNTYNAVRFDCVLLTDAEESTKATVALQTVDKEVTKAIHKAVNRILCRIIVVDRGSNTAIYDTTTMVVLTDVSANQKTMQGTLGPAIDEREPIPNLRAFQTYAPGLYL